MACPSSPCHTTWVTSTRAVSTLPALFHISGMAILLITALAAFSSAFVSACGGELATGPAPFKLDWKASASAVDVGESFTLAVRMYDVQRAGEHGGISVSFPLLKEADSSGDQYSSEAADVEAINYTSGVSGVTFHKPGAPIYHKDNNRMFSAGYLLVETDDPKWYKAEDRTLSLRVTPKRGGDFPIEIRGWICAKEYTPPANEFRFRDPRPTSRGTGLRLRRLP